MKLTLAARFWALALLFACWPADGFAQVTSPPNGADYWTEPGFKEYPVQGPEKAKGAIFWSHGVKGREAQYQYPPSTVVRQFARDGWDVIKVNRNPTYENGWSNSGFRHVRDLTERTDKAKAEGYRMVMAAGVSYGGAISIEASVKSPHIDIVLALAPGHGSDAASIGNRRNYETLTDQLATAIQGVRAAKIVVQVADKDEYHPFEIRGPKLRAALASQPSFVLFDEAMPIKGAWRRFHRPVRGLVRVLSAALLQ